MKVSILGFSCIFACQDGVQESTQNASANNAEAEIAELSALLQNPDGFREKCRKTKSTIVKERCKTLEQRPHLFQKNPESKPLNQPKSNGTAQSLKNVQASTEQCRPGENESHCREQRAVVATTVQKAASECMAVQSKVWKDECFFNAAERRLQRFRDRYHESAELCALSGSYRYNCFQHLSINMAGNNRKDWERSKKTAAQISDYWASKNKTFGREMEAIFWSTEIDIYASKAKKIDNMLFKRLPAQAHPHVWSHLSLEFVKRGRSTCSLSECTTMLLDVYEGTRSIPLVQRAGRANNVRRMPASKKRKNNSAKKSVYYLNNAVRILGENPKEEVQISLLEAAIYTNTNKDWFEEGLKSTPAVQRTAQKNKINKESQ